MLKSIAFILSIYFLNIALLPCADIVDSKSVDKREITFAGLHDVDQEPEEDACAPFCICSCCNALQVLAYAEADSFIQLPFFTRFYASKTTHSSVFFSDYLERIWLPPKIQLLNA